MDKESDRIYRYTEVRLQNNGISPAQARPGENLAGAGGLAEVRLRGVREVRGVGGDSLPVTWQ